MNQSLKALLAHSIDYAGLFPPAGLSLEEALRNYGTYQNSPEEWLLGKFVCPASRLEDVATLEMPMPFSVILHSARLAEEIRLLREFCTKYESLAQVESVELALSADDVMIIDAPARRLFFHHVAKLLSEAGLDQIMVFIETQADWAGEVVRELAEVASAAESSQRFAFKLRTGGQTADAFPPAEQLAQVIAHCRDAPLPWKATAGLHHPWSRWDDQQNVWVYGFLNLFVADVLANVDRLDPQVIEAILTSQAARDFAFDEEAFTWQNRRVPVSQIGAARLNGMQSFGSCSFEEPREGLRSLGLI